MVVRVGRSLAGGCSYGWLPSFSFLLTLDVWFLLLDSPWRRARFEFNVGWVGLRCSVWCLWRDVSVV